MLQFIHHGWRKFLKIGPMKCLKCLSKHGWIFFFKFGPTRYLKICFNLSTMVGGNVVIGDNFEMWTMSIIWSPLTMCFLVIVSPLKGKSPLLSGKKEKSPLNFAIKKNEVPPTIRGGDETMQYLIFRGTHQYPFHQMRLAGY